MMKKPILTISIFLFMLGFQAYSQLNIKDKAGHIDGPNAFPAIINAEIPNAPKLGKPILVMGDKQAVVAKGYGIAAPAFWDWDDDGKKDLLIGEFGSGIEHGTYVGHFLRVYKNKGSKTKPEFTDKFDYARPAYDVYSNGTPLSTKQG